MTSVFFVFLKIYFKFFKPSFCLFEVVLEKSLDPMVRENYLSRKVGCSGTEL